MKPAKVKLADLVIYGACAIIALFGFPFIPKSDNTAATLDISANQDANIHQDLPQVSALKKLPLSNSSQKSVMAQPITTPPKFAAEIKLIVPFTPQAPFANWDLPYQEACEEAVLLMAAQYFRPTLKTSRGKIDPAQADQAIKELVNFQTEKYGGYKDSTAQQLIQLAQDYYQLSARILRNPDLDEIKTELNAKLPMIMLAAGRQLKNPYFHQPGPLYHALIIIGYTKDNKIITHDPGTKRGQNYIYNWTALQNANHDWNNGNVENGEQLMIVIE